MKKLLLIALIPFIGICAQSQNVNIPDSAFKNALVNDTSINTNNDGEIQTTEATAYSGSINVNSLGISDLTGIEAFTNITALSCSFNSIASLDVSNNTSLTALWCLVNQITSITLNTSLEVLDCADNKLTSLDVSQCTNLTTLQCGVNQITSIDITTNTALTSFQGDNNLFTNANFKNGNNTAITGFEIRDNPNLTCIQVDDIAWSTANWTNLDAIASYSLDCTTAGLQDDFLRNSIDIYPNPTRDILHINTTDKIAIQKIQLYSILGKLTRTISFLEHKKEISFQIREIKSGIYLLKIATNKGVLHKKIVKN